ncbi:NAD-dependent epimerase/dehydratase family protein [Georgenia faecalis]|uniref:NAD-dependent epimerase/dehydratase family protein n=1 Tax=Georgenia faecalis TaxID=2483799 RepID=A0ABV9D9L8_9MICO|nr:NAD-dependent epimerase/dehydratase family protein [Georgenia faecalis]
MRVVVVGATGNTGTALMHALAKEPGVTSVVGLARRLPDPNVPPYDRAEWVSVDIGEPDPGTAEEAALLAKLEAVMAGADAVVHLAWRLQPARARDQMRPTNVDGTRRVAAAAAAAGVPHLVVACSVGGYAPVDDDVPRDESWPTSGMETSEYSVDKVDQERLLDEVERAHPQLRVARVRPALIFQERAGSSIARYFLGHAVPVGLLRYGRLPFLPLPAGLRLQAVHADDVADLYTRILLQRATGAFNAAADDVLTAPVLARVLDHGRLVELPPRLVRGALAAAWHAWLVPMSPGWIDMGMGVPVMDTTRARTELGWRPRRTAASSLRELMRGMANADGIGGSPVLYPRGLSRERG